MIYLRFLWAIVTWVVYDIASYVLLIVPGYVIAPLLIALRRVEQSPITGKMILNGPRWLWIWNNDEDGIEPPWYIATTPGMNRYVRMWVWCAWRNPANNLRFIRWLHPVPVRSKIRYFARKNWNLVWQGMFYRFSYYAKGWEFRIGWKYELTDAVLDCNDWRLFGCGFGTRFIKYKS